MKKKKPKTKYEKKPIGRLDRTVPTEAERAIKALRFEGIGMNGPEMAILKAAIKRHHAEEE